jgi:hypothetical protein
MSDRKFVSIALTMETRDAYATVAKIADYIGGDQGDYVADDGTASWHAETMTLRADVQVVDEDTFFAIGEALDYFYATLENVQAPGFTLQQSVVPVPFSISITDTELLTRNLLGLVGNEGGDDGTDDDEGLPQELPDPWDDDDSGQLVLVGANYNSEGEAA